MPELPDKSTISFITRIPVIKDILSRPMGVLGSIIVLLFIFIVIFAPLIAPYHYAEQDIPNRLQPPSSNNWLGTDHLGRDTFSRVIYGSRIAFGTAISAVTIAVILGVFMGLIAGYLGGHFDSIILFLINSLQAFPAVILALAVLALLGPSLVNVVFVIAITWSPNYARVVRAQVLLAKGLPYVEAVRSLGASDSRIIFFHILPNVIAPIIILMAIDLPWVITFEAGLSFLGLGVRPPTPSWGVILSDGFVFIRQSGWLIFSAGMSLILTTFGFTLLGETLRDMFDPKLSGKKNL